MTKRFLLVLFLLVGLTPGAFAANAAQPLNISVDHGTSLTLSGPAASVFIANPEIADVQVMSPTSIMIFGKRTGETTFMATDSSGRTLSQRTVVVLQDLSDLRQELDTAIPGNKIKVQTLPNGIVLTGEARDPAAVADAYKLAQRYLPTSGGDIINRIKVVGSNQIHIRVRFAEVSKSVNNSLGFDWQNLGTVGGFALGVSSGAVGPAGVIGAGEQILSSRPTNTSLNLPNDILGLSKTGSHFNVNGLIDALAQDGLVTILAEPNLTAMSGETASFLAGGEFPVPIPQGNGTISIEFKKYGISLEFTPTLISEDRINLHVKPEVSKLSAVDNVIIDNFQVPSLTVRKAETTIEVASGESFAIGGLLDNDQTQTINKFPLLGDLPVLGALFRSTQYQNNQSELVIIITPYIVSPTGQQLALPMDGFSPPNETESLLGLRQSGGNPESRTMSGKPIAKVALPPAAPIPMAEVPSEEAPMLMDSEASTPVAAPRMAVAPALVAPTPPTPGGSPAPVIIPLQAIATPLPAAPAPAAPIVAPAIQAASPQPAVPTAPIVAVAPIAPLPPLVLNPHPIAPQPLRTLPDHAGPNDQVPAGPGGFILE